MNSVDDYLHAATRANTRRSYQAAVKHFEIGQRLAALAQWHIDQGFSDPTKAPVVKKILRGIQALHPTREKQARPLQLGQLEQVVTWQDVAIHTANATGDRAAQLRHIRDKAFCCSDSGADFVVMS